LPLRINPHVSVFETPYNLTIIQAIDSIENQKLKQTKSKSSEGFSQNFFWIKFSLKNTDSLLQKLILDLDNPHIDEVAFYKQNADSSIEKVGYGGDKSPFYKRSEINRRFIFSFTMQPNETVKYFLMVDKRNASVSFPLKLWEQNNFQIHEQQANIFYGIYFGALVFIALFSLFTGRVIREKLFLSYGLYVITMALYVFTAIGFSFQFLYPNSALINNFSRVVLIVFIDLVFTDFTIRYLNISEYKPWLVKLLYRILAFIIILLIGWIFIAGLFTYFTVIFLNIVYVSYFIILAFISYFLIATFKQQAGTNLIYALSFGFMILGAFILVLIEYGAIPESLFPISPIIIGSVLEISFLTGSLVYRIKHINDQRHDLLNKLMMQKKELMRAFVSGGEKERQLIARELHDNIGAELALLRGKISHANAKGTELLTEIDAIFNDVRNLSHTLAPTSLELVGFKESVKKLVLDFKAATKINCQLDYYGLPVLANEKALQLYRVIQEALKNIQKHAQAKTVEIQFVAYPNKLIITIEDDGIGFEKTNKRTAAGQGLSNMQARITSIDGSIEIDSAKGKGVNILIELPL
jgi:signal transduction histidine kinase